MWCLGSFIVSGVGVVAEGLVEELVGDGAFAFSDEGEFAVGAVDDGGGGVFADAAVDY